MTLPAAPRSNITGELAPILRNGKMEHRDRDFGAVLWGTHG